SEQHDGPHLRHRSDGGAEELPAGVDLGRQRLVLRRHTAHRVADPAVDQRQAIVRPRLIDAAGEAIFEQGRIEQVPGVVAGEGTAGPVGALHTGRKADDQQPRVRIAERLHRGVEPVRVARAGFCAEVGQPWTELAVAVGTLRCGDEITRRNRHRLPVGPSWSRAAGIAGSGDAVRAAPAVRTDRGQAWIAARPGR
ncbi:hypothetical protein chiPu_0031916, partial [Chiloscyllium punctatum]|nr:hypothetical protein [Chiloscyllium punctatum]